MKRIRPAQIIGIGCFSLAVFLPILVMLKYSLSSSSSLHLGGEVLPIWPTEWSFASYAYVLKDRAFKTVVFNSLQIALLTIGFSTLLGVPAAYGLSRLPWSVRVACLTGLLSIRLFPDVSSVISVTQVFISLNLQNTRMGAALAHTLLALPYIIYIIIGVFESIPRDLEEQAMVMGASRLQALRRVVVPLAMPGIIAAAVYTFLLSWDEFIFAYFLLGFGEVNTLTVYLKKQLAFSPPQNYLATLSMFLCLPVILFTLAVQKYMKSGLTAGSVR